ncbi:MAG: C39 family peptidase [Candidatus Pacebacteria bacterium]|nr:C39 family peptidase [Candidatus Paceibacterota bacterium]
MNPFFSQYDVSIPEEWRNRACGIAALKMALRDMHQGTMSELLQEALGMGAWQEEGGFWVHQRLAILAHHHGLPAYNEEFRSETKDALDVPFPLPHHEALGRYGLDKLKAHVAGGKAVLVSVPKHFEAGGSFHMVLLTGFADGHFLYNDSAYHAAEEGEHRRIELEEFFKHWRRLAIFTGWF